MNEPTITFTGNLAAEPELKFTPSGKALANLAVVTSPRRHDVTTSTWLDGTPTFWPCQAWGTFAEHAADSLHKGDRVLVTGRVRTHAWTPTDGPNAGVEQRRLEVVVDELGPSLRFVTTKATRAERATDEPAGDDPPF